MKIKCDISAGELIDKITILGIKRDKVEDKDKLKNIEHEWETLIEIASECNFSHEIYVLERNLKRINEKLWDAEDYIREREDVKDFGENFIKLARSVYELNDERFRLKSEINYEAGSDIVEEKSYKG